MYSVPVPCIVCMYRAVPVDSAPASCCLLGHVAQLCLGAPWTDTWFQARKKQPATRSQPQAASHMQPVTSSQPQAASHMQPATSSQPQAASNMQPATCSQPRAASHEQPATRSQPQAASHKQPATSSQPAGYTQQGTHSSACWGLPAARHALPASSRCAHLTIASSRLAFTAALSSSCSADGWPGGQRHSVREEGLSRGQQRASMWCGLQCAALRCKEPDQGS
jgi:hypothetical protein